MNKAVRFGVASCALVALSVVACSGGVEDPSESTPDGPNNEAAGNGSAGSENSFDETANDGTGLPSPGTGACAPSAANTEIAGNGCDDNANGETDEAPSSCDDGLATTSDASSFARALGLCQTADTTKWGVVSAEYTNGLGNTPAGSQHSLLPKFGNTLKPREGKLLGVIGTSATSEAGGTYGYRDLGAPGTPGSVPGGGSALDVITVKLTIKVPANAKGVGLDYNFFTSEWPWYVGSGFNDGFMVRVTSQAGARNIARDAKGNNINVNNGFFDRCTPNVKLGCASAQLPNLSACPGGDAELAGTGFARHLSPDVSFDTSPASHIKSKPCYGYPDLPASTGGATGWLSSQTAVAPGETITVEVAIWNTKDSRVQSVALIDNIRWLASETSTATTRPEVIN